MGAARRTDPARVCVGPFSRITSCPLARHLRKHLRKAGFAGDFYCVYSTEPPAPLGPAARHRPKAAPGAPPPADPRAGLGSLPTLTGLFGLRLAHEALRILLEKPPATSENPSR
jgi:tRNA A37 threonylcarbamoyladenosine dehydratase